MKEKTENDDAKIKTDSFEFLSDSPQQEERMHKQPSPRDYSTSSGKPEISTENFSPTKSDENGLNQRYSDQTGEVIHYNRKWNNFVYNSE